MPAPRPEHLAAAVARHADGTTVALRVSPRASKTAFAGTYGQSLKLKVAAPPVDGAANEAVIAFLADRCGVAKRDVTLLAGERSRDKLVLLAGAEVADVRRRLGAG